ncbi:hypothetical protein TWF481_009096 [Arthrobotrys musiformis]|uniref:Uncharacterized protein n=1 Tax=Arthrobotrys musiformis TaxID=47236 RepID=A0AAV9W2Q3_9PEZI
MQNLVDMSIMGERKPTGPRAQLRRSGAVAKRDPAQMSSTSSDPLRTQHINTQGTGLIKQPIDDENWPLRDTLPPSPTRSPPPPPPSRPSPIPFDGRRSNYVDAPADERDEIIEALTAELEHEQYLKTKSRWELNEDYLEELDLIAPQTLQETFHAKITLISEKFFPKNISWQLLGARLAPRIKNLRTKVYFPESIKLPCTPETWDAVQNHPDMTSALFVEGIIANTVAYHMCDCPTFQAEGALAMKLDAFYHYCEEINPGGTQGAEWMALTLQMIHKMLHPDETNPSRTQPPQFSDIKPIEKSTQTKNLMWALTDTLRILREAVNMPFGASEWTSLINMTQDLVSEAFKLSVSWHSKPLLFKQYGMSWFSSEDLQGCSDSLGFDLDDKEAVLNFGEGNGKEQHVIAVIYPALLREEWQVPGEARQQPKVWAKPKLLVAPGPPPSEIK